MAMRFPIKSGERHARAWIRRRARRLMRVFELPICMAVQEAATDYRYWVGKPGPVLRLVKAVKGIGVAA